MKKRFYFIWESLNYKLLIDCWWVNSNY
ncbi:uncharacterized protein METZ01_LOCUS351313, partial [marine metagenome]